jgi:hypothetical protein
MKVVKIGNEQYLAKDVTKGKEGYVVIDACPTTKTSAADWLKASNIGTLVTIETSGAPVAVREFNAEEAAKFEYASVIFASAQKIAIAALTNDTFDSLMGKN